MAKRNHRRGGRTTPKGTRPRQLSGRPARPAEPPFVGEAAELLREPSPFGLMAMASGILEVATPRPLDDWPGSTRERVDGPSLFASFVESGWPSLSALALAIGTMHPDAELADHLRQSVDASVVLSGPRWLASMGTAEITGTWLQNDVLGDGENIVVAWRWPHGGAATAFVYIDHNMGTIVKDAFVVPEDGDTVVSQYIAMQEASMSTVPFDPATAKARVVEAIERSERTVTLVETDSWPSCRPMVEWIVRQLPEGGRGFERPEWSEDDRERLLDEFVASTHGTVAGLSDEHVRTLAEPLVWFACDYGPGDPLRWSPVAVEIVLADWYPRKVFGMPSDEMRQLPDVLTGFVRFAHEATSIPRPLTQETVDAVEAWRPDFLAAIGRPGRGPEANAVRLAQIAAGLDPDDVDLTLVDGEGSWDEDLENWDDWDDLDDADYLARAAQLIEADLVELAGGVAELEALTDEPLGAIDFDWSAVPAATREPTAETLDHLDRWATDLYDDEVRTIARAVLAGVVAVDLSVFKRSPRTDVLAAAILAFLAKRLTDRMSAKDRRAMPWQVFTQKELAEATGVSASSISSRSQTVANVVERADIDWPRLLHSTQRAEMLESRRVIAEWRSRET